MRNDHGFMLSNPDWTTDFCWGDSETEDEGLKVKGHGLWTLNVTVTKTEIWSLTCSWLYLLYLLRRSARDSSLFSVHYLRTLISEYLYSDEEVKKLLNNVNPDNTFDSFGPIFGSRHGMLRWKLLVCLITWSCRGQLAFLSACWRPWHSEGAGRGAVTYEKGAWLWTLVNHKNTQLNFVLPHSHPE